MPFWSGLLLGLAMILPIGPQNLFVLNQGLSGGFRYGLLAAVITSLCDTTLILLGALGAANILSIAPWVRTVMLVGGSLFLLYLGVSAFRRQEEAAPSDHTVLLGPAGASVLRRTVLTGLLLSWGNPHAILDTVVILGSAIAAWEPDSRRLFAGGTIVASWLFFACLALAGAILRVWLTPNLRVWVRRASGTIMLVFALLLAREAIRV